MAVAVEKRISKVTPINHLFLPLPDTDFREFLEEIEEFVQFAPEILEMIEKDLDAYALKKKRIRLEDRKFFEKQTHDLEGLDIEQQDILVTDLQDGRPRMPAFSVYLFMMIRGFLGSLTTKQSRRFLRESMSLYGFLQNRGLPMPGVSTILENVNQITLATYKLLMDKQIAYVLKDELDDFKKLTIDSTSVKANSCWPTDSKIIFGLLQRAYRLGQKLQVFEVKNFCKRCVPHWLEEIDKLDFQICLVAGKPKAKGKLKK
ncbi:MAG: hypothetical protein PF495_13950 [Spirochaetales bacterium]|jgi:hypothetical protein|nr:hypothetical protein [Spirochaetales bacterium]